MGSVHVLEDQAVKFEILKEEDSCRLIDWKKLGQPRNWVKLGFKLGNVRVVKTSRHIIIHPGKLRNFDADRLLVTAGQIVGRVRLELMVRFGMVLSEEGVPLLDPVWGVFTPEAEAFEGAGTFKVHLEDGAVGVWIILRLIAKGILSITVGNWRLLLFVVQNSLWSWLRKLKFWFRRLVV